MHILYGGRETVVRVKLIIFTLLVASRALALEPEAAYSADPQALQDAAALIGKIEHVNKNSQNDIEAAEAIIEKTEKIKEQNRYEKDVRKIEETVNDLAKNKQYQNHENWVKNNQQRLFAKQAQPFASVDVVSKNDKVSDKSNKDAISQLLQNYHFKQDDMKKAQAVYFPLMIFVSSSIPQSSLKDLMIQAKKSGGVLVFRGFVGSLKNTTEFLARISKENVSAIIDPRLFDIFKVGVVPTFIVLANNTQGCDGLNCAVTPLHDRVSGNISLNYALETIAAQGDAKTVASSYLKKLEGGVN